MSAPAMRVALVCDAVFPYHTGGKEIRYHELARGLSREGQQVDVYTMQWWPTAADPRDGRITYRSVARHRPLYLDDRRSTWQAVAFAAGCLRLLTKSFDLVDADHMPYLQLFPLRLVATLRRRPLVVTWHEVWGRPYWQAYLGRGGALAARVEQWAMRLPDHIIAASEETGQRLRAATNGRVPVTVVPNGLDRQLIAATPAAAGGSDILFVGRLLEHKGVHLLLQALAHLRSAGMTPSCQVVGSGPELHRLQAQARALGVDRQVTFTSGVDSHAEVFALMKAARLFVLPSVREGYGIAVAEAIACGVPVVTTDHPDNLARLLVHDAAIGTVCAADAQALSAALQAALRVHPEAADRPAPDPAASAGLAWQDRVRDTMEVYQSCLRR